MPTEQNLEPGSGFVWAIRCAGWWTLDYAYAGWWQLRSIFSSATASDYQSGDRCPVLILPGVYEHWRFVRPLMKLIQDHGHPVYVVDALRLNLLPIERAAALVADYLDESGLERVIIVAHSKGGLVGKAVMAKQAVTDTKAAVVGKAGTTRVERMVAICTPFAGSRYARYTVSPVLRAFSANHPELQMLIANTTINSRITSVFGVFDPHIPEGSELAGARNVRLGTGGHFRILGTQATADAVIAALDAGD